MSLAVKNGRVFIGGKLVDAEILCEGGKIKRIAKRVDGDETVNAQGKIVLPGVIDAHVHFRVPGMEHKEDWITGSRSAAKGGVTTVLDMPNTLPPTTTRRLLDEKRRIVKGKSLVNYGFYLGATKENMEEIKKAEGIPGVKLYMASTTGTLLVEDDEGILNVMRAAKDSGKLIVAHAEDESLVKEFGERARRLDEADPLLHVKARPKQCVIKGAKRACELAEKAGNRLHVTHISTKDEVDVINSHKGVTCDTTTSYLFLEERDLVKLGNYAKMNPPVRSHADRMAMWDGIRTGKIQIVDTDHAPHTREEKDKGYWEAPSGVPGVQTLVPLLLNEINRGNLLLERFVKLVCENPAKIMKLKGKGFIGERAVADLTIVDMKLERTLHDDDIESKCGWTPYAGRRLKGWPTTTIVNGEVAWDGTFGELKGREIHEY
ncbi:MAG: dihydroorotase [Candidatus Diapherotrites archaeon]|nr:dihydroorotase [Candidatus Diapherotrites archaeon]